MKDLFFLSVICSAFLFSSCNVGVKKDLVSGLNISNDGLSVEEAYLSVDNKKIKDAVPYGSTVTLTVTGVEGLIQKNGKVFPDASILVKNKKGETVASLGGLFDEFASTGLDAADVKKGLTLSLTCQSPIKMNEEYLCEFELKDRNSKGQIKVSNTLKMQAVEGTNYKPNGLTADGIFYSRNNETSSLNENTLSAGDQLNAYFTGLKGFKEENGKVWIDASVSMQDLSGNPLIEVKDLFAAYDSTGIALEDAAKLITLTLKTGDKVNSGKDYKAIFSLKDKKGDAALSNEFNFKVR
jgi:hypothetical protein